MFELTSLHRPVATAAAAFAGAILGAQAAVAAPGGPGTFPTTTPTPTEGLVRPFTPPPTATRAPIVVGPVDKPIRVCQQLCLRTVSETQKWVPPGLPGYGALLSGKAVCPEGTRPTGGGVLLHGDILGVQIFENGPLLDPETGYEPMRGRQAPRG